MYRQHTEEQIRAELEWLTSRRWFGDKARPVVDVRVLLADVVEVDAATLLLTVVEFTYEWGDPGMYFVPLIAGDAALAERDAAANRAILRWFAAGFGEQRVIEGEGTWRWRTIGELPQLEHLADTDIRPIAGEQSNSSIIFGDGAIGKLFRRIQPGVNPDLEIGEHLMQVGSFAHAADLFGVVELTLDGQRIDIAALQAFVPNVGDGWTWLLGELAQADRRDALIEDIRILGTRTGEMHLVLAEAHGDTAFTPVSIDEDQAQAIIRRVIAEMEASVEGLTHHLSPAEIERLHKGLGLMMGDAWSMVGTLLIRVHGDYHLGQTLRTKDDDFVIIDFEGEPSRSMDERRQKLPALKDVAGMVRSLDYAGATLMQGAANEHERAELATWVKNASEAFVDAWRQAVAESPLQLSPVNDDAFASVLNLMIAEKALYELRYEMNNRPDWLWIPLGALQRLIETEAVE